MKNVRIRGAAYLALLLVAGVLLFLWAPGPGAAFLAAALLFPALSLLANLFVRRGLRAELQLSPQGVKGRPEEAVLAVRNDGILPCPRLFARISAENRLTKERASLVLPLSAVPKGTAKERFRILPEHCGYLDVRLEQLLLADWSGLFCVKAGAEAGKTVSVLPQTFPAEVSVQIPMSASEEAENWSEVKPGQDIAEVFALRDYVPGDPVRQIHWKLSSKRNRLILREGSLPIEQSLLLFFDKNAGAPEGEDMDALAESVVSVAQALAGQGYVFTLGWTEGRTVCLEEIGNEEALLGVIPSLIKNGAEKEAPSGAAILKEEGTASHFARVLYFAKEIPADYAPFTEGAVSALVEAEEEPEGGAEAAAGKGAEAASGSGAGYGGWGGGTAHAAGEGIRDLIAFRTGQYAEDLAELVF